MISRRHDDFYSKIERIEQSSVNSSDDFKKELKKQREIFEERVKAMEAHQREIRRLVEATSRSDGR